MKQIKEIRNPFDADHNMCFGCGPKNRTGLKLSFREDDEKLYALWDPLPEYQGYINVLHGGIIATLLDEAGAWCIYVKAGTTGMTSVMTVRYLKPVHISKGKIRVEARLLKQERTKAIIAASLYDGEGKLCAEGDLDYFIYPEMIARSRYYYPGKDAFYYPDEQNTLP